MQRRTTFTPTLDKYVAAARTAKTSSGCPPQPHHHPAASPRPDIDPKAVRTWHTNTGSTSAAEDGSPLTSSTNTDQPTEPEPGNATDTSAPPVTRHRAGDQGRGTV